MTNEEKLAQARAALHQLRIGKQKAVVRYGDRTVTYTQADLADLKQYVAELEELCGETTTQTRGEPFRVTW